MDELRIGRVVRALRHRLRVRQVDVGDRARVSQGVVSLIERGHLDRVSMPALRDVLRAVDAELVLIVRWRGGELDRLLDEQHAWLGGRVTDIMTLNGWTVVPEVTYSIFGERGSIDLVAWHAASRTLLVIELKSELTSIEETLRRHDAKVRLAAGIVGERFGWAPTRVGRLLVLPDSSTNRRRVDRHSMLLHRAYPTRNIGVRQLIKVPGRAKALDGLWFVSDTRDVRGMRPIGPRRRIRPAGSSVATRCGERKTRRVIG
jgi:transcriptional regulator with XRE-family HTH domain